MASIPDALPARLLTLSTLQILASATAFTGVRPMPLASLSHVARRYIELLAESAKANAEVAGRPVCTGWDVVGVLEALDGPGAVEGLFGWCRENLKQAGPEPSKESGYGYEIEPKQDKAVEERVRLAEVATIMEGIFVKPPPIRPSARLSFLQLSDEEIAALDRAGDSDLEESEGSSMASPPRRPLAESSSDSEDSESDSEASTSPPPQRDFAEPKPIFLATDAKPVQDEAGLWRSKTDIPGHVPFFLPPFPGFEKPVGGEALASTEMTRTLSGRRDQALDVDEIEEAAAQTPMPPVTATTGSQQDAYKAAVPFASSILNETGGASSLPHLQSPLPGSDAEDGGDVRATPSASGGRKRRRVDPPGSLAGFIETVTTLTNPRIAPPDPPYLPHLPARRRIAAAIGTPDLAGASDTLSAASIVPVPYRQSRRTAGWLPYSTSILPELKPFASVLPNSVTAPVPDSGVSPYPAGYVAPAGSRNPSTIPLLLRNLSARDPKADGGLQNVLVRVTRTGPPAPLGDQGEALPYVVAPPALTSSGALSETRYLEWGFEWQGLSPDDRLPPSKAEQPPLRVPPIPPMPKLKMREEPRPRTGSVVIRLGGASLG